MAGNGLQRAGYDPPTRVQRPITPERQRVMLDTLAKTGNYAMACRAASFHSKTGAYRSFKDLEKRDPAFADAVEEAMRQADGLLLEHARNLAMGKVMRPKWFKDQIVGEEAIHDSRIMEVMLKGRFREFSDHVSVEHSGGVTHSLDAGVFLLSKRDLIALNSTQIEQLKEIVVAVARFRSEQIPTDSLEDGMTDITPEPETIEHIEGWEREEA